MKLYKVKKSKHFEGEAIYFNPSKKSDDGKYLFLDKIKFDKKGKKCWVEIVFYNHTTAEFELTSTMIDVRIIRWLLAYQADNISTAATMAHLKTTLKLIDEESKQ